MLEEAIRNYEKVHPAEIALSMLSFLQSELPAGGNAAESRFFNLFVPLCDCIFGPMVIASPHSAYRHKDGGWLSTQHPWTRTIPTSGGSVAASSLSSPRHPSATKLQLSTSGTATNSHSLDSDPVVKLLGTAGKPSNSREQLPITLIEAVSRESQNRRTVTFQLPFHSLPQPLQDAWLALIKQRNTMIASRNLSSSSSLLEDDVLLLCSKNDMRLFGQLLRKGPDEQIQLQLYAKRIKQHSSNYAHPEYLKEQIHQLSMPLQQNSPFYNKYNVSSFMTSSGQHSSVAGVPSPKSTGKEVFYDAQPASPDIILSMLEYYLFLFLHFPLAVPDRGNGGSTTTTTIPGVNVHRIQSTTSHTEPLSNLRVARETFGESLYYHIFRRYMRHFLPYETEDNNRSIALSANDEFPESELFFRLMIAMWLESQNRLSPTACVVQSMMERRRHRTGFTIDDCTSTALVLDLHGSFDLTHAVGKYETLPIQVHKCLRTAIIHVLLDPGMEHGGLNSSTRKSVDDKLNLSPCIAALQQPVYNYIRSTFRFAPIHSSSESSFYGALNIWLIWLEPWNVTQSRNIPFSAKNATQHIMGSAGNKDSNKIMLTQRALTIPRVNQASKYDASEWESYVAANVYLYVVPFAIFLRRARELDFSPNKYDRSMEIVQRVFRVFTPALIDSVSRHLDVVKNSEESSRSQVKHHRENLGPFAPPAFPMSLTSLQGDMQSLLEEVTMHHVKKVRELDTFDWLVGKVEGLFGAGVVSGEEKTLEALMERAKVITRLPCDYSILMHKCSSVSKRGSNLSSTTTRLSTHTKDGTLTDFGREQLASGSIKLHPVDVHFCGDPMRAKVRNFEIPFLVDLTLWASDNLNERIGLSTREDGKFRINLRFFADYRNSVFVLAVLYAVLMLR